MENKILLTLEIHEQENGNGIVKSKTNKELSAEEFEHCFVYNLKNYIKTYREMFVDDDNEDLASIVAGLGRDIYNKETLQEMAFCLNEIAQLVEEEDNEEEWRNGK